MLLRRFLLEDIKSRELRLLALALVLAVASISSVGFLSERIRTAFSQETSTMLGADLVISSANGFQDNILQQAADFQLIHAKTITTVSMASFDDQVQLVFIRGVDDHFPLKGELTAKSSIKFDALPVPPIQKGTIWIDPILAEQYQLKLGETLTLGIKTFQISGIIDKEPSRSIGADQFSPHVIVDIDDLYDTGLIDQNSRLRFTQAFAGESENIASFIEVIKPTLPLETRVETIEDVQPDLIKRIARFERFFRFVSFVAVILSGITILLCSRHFVARHTQPAAVMRALGMTKRQLLKHYFLEFLWMGLLTILIGCFIGWLTQHMAAQFFQNWLNVPLPSASIKILLSSVGIGFVLLFGFALPPLYHLSTLPIITVLRQDTSLPSTITALGYGVAFTAVLLLMYWQLEDGIMTLQMAGILMGIGLTFTFLSYIICRFIIVLALRGTLTWRLVGRILTRQKGLFLLQTVALSLGLTFLALLMLLRSDLIDSWEKTVPDEMPNYFLINVFPEQQESLSLFFEQHGLETPNLYPMLRTNLVSINGKALSEGDRSLQNAYAQRIMRQGFFLTWTETLPETNSIIEGTWISHTPSEEGMVVSVEEEFAHKMGIHVGDRLVFETADTQYEVEVGCIRRLAWTTMRVNFYIIMTSGALDEFPHTLITSFHLLEDQQRFISSLIKEYPNITAYPVGKMVRQIQDLMDKAIWATQALFWWTLLGGLCVFMAVGLAVETEFSQTNALFRTLGMRECLIKKFCWQQGFLVGISAAFISLMGTSILGIVVGRQFIGSSVLPNLLTLILIFATSLGLIFIGRRGIIRRSLSQPIMEELRQAD